MIKLLVNGRFLSQKITGVQRYGREFFFALDRLLQEESLDKGLWDIRVLCPIDSDDVNFKVIEKISYGKLKGQLWEQIELPFYSAFKSADRILFCPGNSAPLASLIIHVKTIVVVHCLSQVYFPKDYSLYFRWFYKIVTPVIMKFSDWLVMDSEAERSTIRQLYPCIAHKSVSIQLGGLSDKKRLRSTQLDHNPRIYLDGIDVNELLVLIVGSLSLRKNLSGILKASAEIDPSLKIKFVVVGVDNNVVKVAYPNIDMIQGSRVVFLGSVTDDMLAELYLGALCLLFPSFHEGSGLPPLEAMAYGCPVIASDIPVLRERCGDAAFYCNPHDPKSIAGAVVTIAQNHSLRDKLRQAGIDRANHLSWERCVLETMQTIAQKFDSHALQSL